MVPTESFPDLPFDIIITILMMVSAEDLVRFMLVCRKWHNLITSADFVLKHLQFWTSRGNNYLLCGPEVYTPGKSLRLLTDKSHVQVLERKIRFNFRTHCYMLMSSSNGLVFLTDGDDIGPNLYLYNPFIHKFKPITSTCINVEYTGKYIHWYVLGFGYHSQANDYKIVRIAYVKDENDSDIDDDVLSIDDFSEYSDDDIVDDVINYETEVEVYSLNTDSWRRVEVSSFAWFMPASASGALVKDCLHWMASTRFGNTGDVTRILSFDLGREVFQTIGLPHFETDVADDTSKFYRPDVISYNDELSLVGFSNGLNGCCSLWVMSEYGVLDSWSLLFIVVLDGIRVRWPLSSSFTFTKHGELVYIHKEGYVVVNPFTQQRQDFRFGLNDDPDEFFFLPLTNNLTLIESPKEA